ncbi:MAG TPA: glycoside hydrolase family 2 TIM barrel-domain containing protein [Gemmataceae bacterium]|nr:glycoside hydrolase family 2 TIM barrel-domain containing protein [Gemmataceae bacterium]
MRRMRLAIVVVVLLGTVIPLRADWQPAKGPLMTRWAKEVSPARVHPEYPRPQMVRSDWLNLNGLWQLAFAKEADSVPAGKELTERILVPFPVESALSGVMKRADRLWYRRTFSVPKAWAGRRTLLHFGAIDWAATVWVNGKELGSHRGGYDPFSFDISEALKPEGEQELVVGVWDPTDAGTQPRGKQVNRPQGIYYTPTTGIWQTVWLEPVAKASIASLKIVPDVDAGKVHVAVQGRGTAAEHSIRVVALDGERAVGTIEGPLDRTLDLSIATPKLWSPDAPFLYDLRIELRQGGQSVDTVQSYFGMRKIAIGKDDQGVTRMLLNGKFIFQLGPLDQGFWPDGLYTAPTDEALKYDIEITKKLGFNLARKHVKVEPDRWYYWCDKLGLLVWQDMPSGDKGVAPGKGEITRTPESAKEFEIELARMLDGLHNHPCIIMWVVFNEGWGQFDTARLTRWTKEHDPSRLVDCASGWNDRGVGDVHDIHVYPGPGGPDPEPNRAAVLGEFGGLGLGVDGHTWTNKTWGYRGTQSSEDLTRKYEQLLRGVWKLKNEKGLSAAIYTQTTDVETEANGLMTYDRAVIKMDQERVAAVNKGDLSRVPEIKEVVPTSQQAGQLWRYTFEKPGSDWFKPGFDDAAWKEGRGGFGTKGTPGAVVRTEWKTDDIWIRRPFTLPEPSFKHLNLFVHHDEDAEIYINGVLAARVSGYITDYEGIPMNAEARAALHPGQNLFAVHCKQTKGGQYIDVGIVDVGK